MTAGPHELSGTDYDAAWTRWADMVKYSPAPFHRRRMILQLARTLKPKSVLDVGCGSGELIRAMHKQLRPDRMVGVDLSPAVVESNRRAIPYAQFHSLDISDAPLAGQWDLVVASEVIEHIEDYRSAIQHLRMMCSGHLIVTVPSGRIYPIDRQMGHVRHFTAAEMTLALEASGFKVRNVWQWGFPWHSLYKRAINSSPEAMLNRFSGGEYSATDRWLSRAITGLFYLNTKRFGSQLVTLAQAV